MMPLYSMLFVEMSCILIIFILIQLIDTTGLHTVMSAQAEDIHFNFVTVL